MIDYRLTFHPIRPGSQAALPDADLEILVFDGDLDDTVVAVLDYDGERLIWRDVITGQPLPNPKWWAEKPLPEPQQQLCWPWVRIGSFTLSKLPGGKIWIQADDGEGGAFSMELFAAAVEEFYRVHF